MEGEVHEMNMAASGGGGSASAATSRWNPTKEQITMLETLYRQGIRTPTAEQIEEITGRLQAYGHIEGKNVFYWFQNHKARQRQKQKQENNFANYFHRYLHHHQPLPVPPLFPPPQYPPCPNVVCNPYYMPQPELGFYPTHQYPKVLVPPSTTMKKRLPRPDHLDHPTPRPTNGYTTEGGSSYNIFRSVASGCKRNIEDQVVNCRKNLPLDHQETLELFPMHPTGILQARSSSTDTDHDNSTAANICMDLNVVEEEEEGSGTAEQIYFDFLSGN